jgi:RNA polymerase sigma-70 factor, ECF subfamily
MEATMKAKSPIEAESAAFSRYLRRPTRRRMAAVVRLLHAHVWSVALRVAGNHADAADLCQDVFLSLLLRPPPAGSVRSPRGYLACRVLTLSRNRRASAERRRLREVESARKVILEDGSSTADVEAVWGAIEELPDRVRTVVELRYLAGLQNAGIAAALGVSEATVDKDLHRGRELLRGRLTAEVLGSLALPGILLEASGSLPPPDLLRSLLRITRVGEALAPAGAAALVAGGIAVKKTVASIAIAASILIACALALRFLAEPDPPTGPAVASLTEPLPPPRRSIDPQPASAIAPEPAAGDSRSIEPTSPPRDPDTGDLLVRLLWEDGDPAVGLGVAAWPRRAGNGFVGRVERVAGPDGSVLLDDLPAGPVTLLVDRAGPTRRAEVPAGGTAEISLTLPDRIHVRGVVVDRESSPVAGADVWLSELNTDNIGGRVVATTAADGTFSLRGVETGRYVAARARGYAPSSAKFIGGGRGEDFTARLVLPDPGGAMSGIVFRSDGRPASGAAILIGRRDSANGSHSAPPPPVRVYTDELGAFEIHGLPTGDIPVVARAAGAAPAEIIVAVAPGQTSHAQVRLGPGAALAGTVVDGTGRAVEGAHVRAGKGSRLTFHSDPMLSQVRTDGEGFYAFEDLPPGETLVAVDAGEKGKTEAPVLLAAGGRARRDFALLPGPDIRGQVIAEDGRPLGRAMVQVGQPHRNAFGHDLADADGRFAIEDLNTDEYYLEVIESGTGLPCARLEAVRPGIEELRIVVRESERSRSYIAGKVEGPDGKSIRGARVFYPWDRPLGYVPQASTGLLGDFSAGPLPAAVYEISVEADGLPRAWFGKHELAPGKTLDLGTLRLQQPGFLVARIRREDGQPLHEIAYKILDVEDRVQVHVHLPDEPVRRDPLAPGRHRVEARGKGLEPFAADVEIVVGQETELEVVLRVQSGDSGAPPDGG